jgi:hypothetical protein
MPVEDKSNANGSMSHNNTSHVAVFCEKKNWWKHMMIITEIAINENY